MASFLSIPNAVIYKGNLTALSLAYGNAPKEGNKGIPFSMDWGAGDGGSDNAIQFNLGQSSQIASLSQIAGLFIDNTGCSADLEIIFPDTQFQLTVPARTEGYFAALTSSTIFIVIAANAAGDDVTRGMILNFNPEPVEVPQAIDIVTAAADSIVLTSTGTTQLIANTVNGILDQLQIMVNGGLGGASAGTATITIQDGLATPSFQFITSVKMEPSQQINPAIILDLKQLNARFYDGVKIVITGGTNISAGQISVNATYRQH